MATLKRLVYELTEVEILTEDLKKLRKDPGLYTKSEADRKKIEDLFELLHLAKLAEEKTEEN